MWQVTQELVGFQIIRSYRNENNIINPARTWMASSGQLIKQKSVAFARFLFAFGATFRNTAGKLQCIINFVKNPDLVFG